MANRSKRRRPLRTLLILAAAALLTALFVRWDNTALQVTHFEPVFTGLPEGFDGCRLVVLSDLHGGEFGPENQELFAAAAEAAPDYIFYLGDLEDLYRGPREGYAEEVARGLSAIAPLYYVTGNHEWAIGGVPELKARLESCGAQVLSNEFATLERNGDTVVLAGIDDPRPPPPRPPPPPSSTACWGRIWCCRATATGESSACPSQTGSCPWSGRFFPPTRRGSMRRTARRCLSPGAWGIPDPRSGCSTARRLRW